MPFQQNTLQNAAALAPTQSALADIALISNVPYGTYRFTAVTFATTPDTTYNVDIGLYIADVDTGMRFTTTTYPVTATGVIYIPVPASTSGTAETPTFSDVSLNAVHGSTTATYFASLTLEQIG